MSLVRSASTHRVQLNGGRNIGRSDAGGRSRTCLNRSWFGSECAGKMISRPELDQGRPQDCSPPPQIDISPSVRHSRRGSFCSDFSCRVRAHLVKG